MEHNNANKSPQHLAWHETLEIHELVAFQSVGLMKIKMAYSEVNDPALKVLYSNAINGLSTNLRDLLKFYPLMPTRKQEDQVRVDQTAFYSGDLLALFKTGIRNYAIAISETATPSLRNVLQQHLNRTIQMHADVYSFMYQRGYYPSYNLTELLENDQDLAKQALSYSY
ncbi:spore coat protein F [Halobacillus karajensis]|uniref:spore coat protein n=1 Tax=Halobacillus karajensis TaxID=195088 RepID=UPI0008A72B3A|nr:spore coat protein [Halobacillus karajensis]SEI14280.1 spore coat protein F [Halobacillus karajensis]